jgi:transposase
MARLYGRAPCGKRLIAAVPHGHWKTSTFIGALRCDGLTAPGVFDGAINGEMFRAYVEQILAPTLKPGDVVIMDNLRSHKLDFGAFEGQLECVCTRKAGYFRLKRMKSIAPAATAAR